MNDEEETQEQPTQKEAVSQELTKIIGRYGIEAVLDSLICLTEDTEFPEVADLHSRLVMALSTYRKSYESRQKKPNLT